MVADHLSRIFHDGGEPAIPTLGNFPDESLFRISTEANARPRLDSRARVSAETRPRLPLSDRGLLPETEIQPSDPEFQLLALQSLKPWYAHLVNFLVRDEFPPNYTKAQKDKIKSEAKFYVWDDRYL